MGVTLITGSGGFIGRALLQALKEGGANVLGFSRTQRDGENVLRGDFASYEDLRRLDRLDIERVCHLGAVTGGCTEHDGMSVNVAGTRTLLRYVVDRGCRKVVLASSIAAVGLADAEFVPAAVPIGDDHACLARDAYGMSKHLMELVGDYFSRVDPELEITALRLASVFPDTAPPPKCEARTERGDYALAKLTQMCLSDALSAFRSTLDVKLGPGFRVLNATPVRAWSVMPTRMILQNWFGDALDVSWFSGVDRDYSSVFSNDRLREMVGFSPCC